MTLSCCSARKKAALNHNCKNVTLLCRQSLLNLGLAALRRSGPAHGLDLAYKEVSNRWNLVTHSLIRDDPVNAASLVSL